MTRFQAPPDGVCGSVAPLEPAGGRCVRPAGHGGVHRHNGFVWHDPPVILIEGQPPDLTANTERWRDGRVLLGDDLEPDLGFDPYDIPY